MPAVARKARERKEVRIEKGTAAAEPGLGEVWALVPVQGDTNSTQEAMATLRKAGLKAGHYRVVTVQWEGGLKTETKEKVVLAPTKREEP